MKMSKGYGFVAAILIAGLLTACAATQPAVVADSPVLDRVLANNTLVVGTAASMPPFNMTSKEGEVIGFEVDMARMLANALGVRLDIETMNFGELIPALEAGKVDMVLSSMTITAERNAKVAFVGPYFISGKAFLTTQTTIAETEDPADINSPATTLTALRGSTSELFVNKLISKAKLVPADDYDQAVQMVLDGQADAMVADYPICIVSLLRHPDSNLVSLITPLTWEPIGIALPKGDPHFVNLVENYLMGLKGSGELDALTERWFDQGDWLVRLP